MSQDHRHDRGSEGAGVAAVLRRAGLACLFAALAVLPVAAAAQQMAIEPRFEQAGVFHGGVAPAKEGGLWGLIDRSGAWVLEPAHREIGPGGDGLFPFLSKEGGGYLDTGGKVRIEGTFDEVWPFEGGVAPVRVGREWLFFRADGKAHAGQGFFEVSGYDGRLIAARDKDGWALFRVGPDGKVRRSDVGIYDENEDKYVAPDRLYSISEQAVVAAAPLGEWLVDARPRPWDVIEHSAVFHSVRRRSEGMAAVAGEPGRWGYMHWSGRLYWEGRFEDATVFSEGFAAVKSGGKWGYIDRAGRFVVEPAYDAAFPFRSGFAVVRLGDKRGFLRNDGAGGIQTFIEPRYEDASRFSQGLAAVRVGGKWGYVADPDHRELALGEITEIVPD